MCWSTGQSTFVGTNLDQESNFAHTAHFSFGPTPTIILDRIWQTWEPARWYTKDIISSSRSIHQRESHLHNGNFPACHVFLPEDKGSGSEAPHHGIPPGCAVHFPEANFESGQMGCVGFPAGWGIECVSMIRKFRGSTGHESWLVGHSHVT